MKGCQRRDPRDERLHVNSTMTTELFMQMEPWKTILSGTVFNKLEDALERAEYDPTEASINYATIAGVPPLTQEQARRAI